MAAAVLAERAARQRRQTAQQLLEDYAAFAAWSYGAQLREAVLEAGWMVLNPILHENPHIEPEVPTASSLLKYRRQSLERCRCDPAVRPATYFAYVLGSDSLGLAGQTMDATSRTALRQQFSDAIRNDVGEKPLRIGVVPLKLSTASLASYGLMPMGQGDTVVYGFTFDTLSLERLAREFAQSPKLLPATVTRGRAVGEIIAIEISTPAGDMLYRDEGFPAWKIVREERLPLQAAGLALRAAVRPEAATFLVAGGLPEVRVPYLFGVGILAVALAVIALLQLRREHQLARLRADFVAAVSHELRTPLAQIRLFLDTIELRRYTSEDQREWLMSHVNREANRLSHLVENLLQFTQMDRGSTAPLEPEPVDLSDETAELLDAFAPLASSHKVTFQRELREGVGAMVDRARYQQIVLNLLDNAVKFGPRGQTITVSVTRENGVARLRVSDQGNGIPEHERSRIWEAFYRGRSNAAQAVGGSGIGLAIVHDTAVRSGGRVWVEDAPGGGAVFIVELPVNQPSAAPVTA